MELKVLSIGNSFSVDGMEYVYDIAKEAGVTNIVLGNLYIGGASIQMHIEQIENNLSDYIYYKNNTGSWKETYHAKLIDGLLDEDWDIISLQQVSHYSGLDEKYNENLTKLIAYVNTYKTNKKAKLAWHMTWAYQNKADHGGFAFYKNDQTIMYHRILECVKKHILPLKEFSYIIPSGTAIQNLRQTEIKDTLTRDGFHLSFGLGRYTASLCWVKTLTNLSIKELLFRPENVTVKEAQLAKIAVEKACDIPYEITE